MLALGTIICSLSGKAILFLVALYVAWS